MFAGVLLGLLVAGDVTGALMVSAGSDPGAPCQAAQGLALALQRRLPGTRVGVGEATAAGELGVTLEPEGQGQGQGQGAMRWRLRVVKPSGEVVLLREVRPAESECAAVVETCVLIVDRYLSNIDWPGRELRVASEPQPAGVALAAGLAAWAELPADAAPALAVDLSLRRGRMLAALWGAATEREQRPVVVAGDQRGTLEARRFLVGTSLGGCGRLASTELCGGGLVAASLASGGAEGAGLVRGRSAWTALPALGAFGRAEWGLPAGFELGVEAVIAAPLGRAALEVEGTGLAARSPRVQGLLCGRLGWRLP
jgi:hypothetical protein